MNERWIILGTGRVGKTLLLLAKQLNIEVAFTWSFETPLDSEYKKISGQHFIATLPKNENFSNAIVFISVVDDAIASVSAALVKQLMGAKSVFHLSGLLSSILLKREGINAACASMHPVVAISDPRIAIQLLPKIFWSIEGDADAIAVGKRILKGIGVEPVVIDPKAKPLYHAAAVFSAGQLVSLLDTAILVAQEAGLSREDARRMLLPLAQSALDNLQTKSTVDALTGPLSRGDYRVIGLHEEALKKLKDPIPLKLYKNLTRYMSKRLKK